MNSKQSTLLTKLTNLKNCILRIENKKPFSVDELKANYDLQDIISLNLQRAIQSCVDISAFIISETEKRPPETMADSFLILNNLGVVSKEIESILIKAVGMRNVLVHEYTEIDWNTVHRVITDHLDVFKDFTEAILKYSKIDLHEDSY